MLEDTKILIFPGQATFISFNPMIIETGL